MSRTSVIVVIGGQMNSGPDAWTAANGGLTATNKINRKVLFPVIYLLII